jgi:hypothetical protein
VCNRFALAPPSGQKAHPDGPDSQNGRAPPGLYGERPFASGDEAHSTFPLTAVTYSASLYPKHVLAKPGKGEVPMAKMSTVVLSLLAAIGISGCVTPKNNTGLTPFSPFPASRARLLTRLTARSTGRRQRGLHTAMMQAYHYPIPRFEIRLVLGRRFRAGRLREARHRRHFLEKCRGHIRQGRRPSLQGELQGPDSTATSATKSSCSRPDAAGTNHLQDGDGKGFGPKMETWHIPPRLGRVFRRVQR